jgi:hypothetical protein
MKNLVKYVVAGLFAIPFCCGVSTVNAQTVLDGPYVKEHTPTRKVVPYTHLREADVMWAKRIWRVIDLREKMNHPLYYPVEPINDRKSLFDIIKQALWSMVL